MEYRSYTKKHRSGAFTLAEFLVVIAITLILAGVSFVAAIRYQSSLRRMEMDRTAPAVRADSRSTHRNAKRIIMIMLTNTVTCPPSSRFPVIR